MTKNFLAKKNVTFDRRIWLRDRGGERTGGGQKALTLPLG